MTLEPPVRVNARISHESNKWLDERSFKTAITKSALINIAVEQYMKEVEISRGLPKIITELEKHGLKLGL